MNQYLTYLFDQFTLKSSSSQFNNLIKQQLLQLRQVDLTKIYRQITNSTLLFNQINLLLAKGLIKYSPANCTLELSLPNLLIHQRLYKITHFAHKYLDKSVAIFVNQFIEQGLQNGLGFPILFQTKLLQKPFSFNPLQQINQTQNISTQQETKKKSKSKPKNEQSTINTQQQKSSKQNQYNYHKLIYEYKSKEKKQIPSSLTTNEQPKQSKQQANKKSKSSKKQKQSIQTQQQNYQEYMLNIEQLTKLLQASKLLKVLNSRFNAKEKPMSLFEFINLKQRQSLIQQIQYQKIQQFIAQVLSPNCLLVFNLVKKYPYITEKQLVKLTLLQVLQTRSALNQLVQKGFLLFYNQNARTIVYKVVQMEILVNKYLNIISKSIMNFSLATQRIGQMTGINLGSQKVKNKLIQLQCQIQRLDDLMLIFGW